MDLWCQELKNTDRLTPHAYLLLPILLDKKGYDKNYSVFLADKHAHTPGKVQLREYQFTRKMHNNEKYS